MCIHECNEQQLGWTWIAHRFSFSATESTDFRVDKWTTLHPIPCQNEVDYTTYILDPKKEKKFQFPNFLRTIPL